MYYESKNGIIPRRFGAKEPAPSVRKRYVGQKVVHLNSSVETTRATIIEVYHFFSNTTPHFRSLRHVPPQKIDLEKKTKLLLRIYRKEKSHGLRYTKKWLISDEYLVKKAPSFFSEAISAKKRYTSIAARFSLGKIVRCHPYRR